MFLSFNLNLGKSHFNSAFLEAAFPCILLYYYHSVAGLILYVMSIFNESLTYLLPVHCIVKIFYCCLMPVHPTNRFLSLSSNTWFHLFSCGHTGIVLNQLHIIIWSE